MEMVMVGIRNIRIPCLPDAHVKLTRFRRSISCSSAAAAAKKRVVVISGPTGAGKTRIALQLAKRLNGEVISADSVQVYQGLDIGSAKPTPTERMEVPHHLIDILHPSGDYSVGQFYEDARQATTDILSGGRVPIVTGGTGLYLRWYIYGKPDVPKASSDITSEVHSELTRLQNIGDWYSAVQLVVESGDPKAQYLAANDWYRLRRSLEIIKACGLPPSAFEVPYDSFKHQRSSSVSNSSLVTQTSANALGDQSHDLDYDFICFFLTNQRVDLYRSIDLRCEDMLLGKPGCDGILGEAKWLLDVGLSPNSNSATRAIGYRQAMEYLERCRERQGQSSAGEFHAFLAEFQRASRNFAKRQLTWFRNENIYHWLDASKPLDKVLDFLTNAYYDQSGTMKVPECLRMRELKSRKEGSALKSYRTINSFTYIGTSSANRIVRKS
uniref:tRNA dimethylallyltransferase n=1 Tax=Kalanchoe fedtschenkoi TaxID=63787 RepID=A0A7N0U5G0_KALFE